MSKYTTEVRFLCESLTGHTESVGFNSVDEILNQAAPLIFDFNFPIYDEAYRLVLEKKILRHYYTREISEETYGLWKLRLEDRMNIIMPYYNKMYESALLTFNPFYDVDLTTQHEGNQNGVENTSDNEHRKRDNTIDRKANENVDEVGNKTGNNSSNKEGRNQRDSIGKEVENAVRNSSSNGIETNNLNSTNEHTGNIKDDNTGEHVIVNNDVGTENNNSNKTGNRNSNYESTNAGTTDSVNSSNESGTSQNTEWDLFSDTPQGGIDGMNIPNSSAPSQSLQNNIYLTTARKDTNDGSTSNNRTGKESSSNVGTENGSGNENNNETASQHNESVSERIENSNTSESNLKTFNEKNEITHGSSKENVSEGVEVNDRGKDNTLKEDESITENVEGIYSEVNTNNIGRNNNENVVDNEEIHGDRSGVKVSTNTDEYLQKVVGKSGGMSYSAMLLEFRETFINIDEMIIEELTDLFFGLW